MFKHVDLSERIYFKEGMSGNPYITTPTISKITNKLSIMITAPLWQDGKAGTTPVCVVVLTPEEKVLDDVMRSIQVGDGGSAFMVDKEGNTIAHYEEGKAGNENIVNDNKDNSELAGLVQIVQEMMTGVDGYGSYSYGGVIRLWRTRGLCTQ